MEIYGRIRRAVLVEGRSQRSVAREFGLARVTVRKMLGYSIPPGYRRKEPAKRPKLGPWVGVIDAILEEDQTKPSCVPANALSSARARQSHFWAKTKPADLAGFSG